MDASRDKPGSEDQNIHFNGKAPACAEHWPKKLRRHRFGAELGGSDSQTCSAAWTRSKRCPRLEVQDIAKSLPGSREQNVAKPPPDSQAPNIAMLPASLPDSQATNIAKMPASLPD